MSINVDRRAFIGPLAGPKSAPPALAGRLLPEAGGTHPDLVPSATLLLRRPPARRGEDRVTPVIRVRKEMSMSTMENRRAFIGGSDARIIMGQDEADLVRLWREKRGELEPKDFSENLVVQLGRATEDLNRHWYERCTAQTITECQKHVRHPTHRWMAATLDGVVKPTGAVFEAKFMLPWAFRRRASRDACAKR